VRIAGHRQLFLLDRVAAELVSSAAITLAENESCWREASRGSKESVSTGVHTGAHPAEPDHADFHGKPPG
jgi:hypothetical protein